MTIRFEDFLKLDGACVPDLNDNSLDYRYVRGLDERNLWVVESENSDEPHDHILNSKRRLLIGFLILRHKTDRCETGRCEINYILKGSFVFPLKTEHADSINELHHHVILMLGKWKLTGENS
jgi:hypothetical protein